MPKDLDCAAGGVLLRVWLSPFDYEPKAAVEIDAGTKVSDIVDRFMPKTLVRSVIHVWVGGEKVPESCWLSVRVLRGAFVTLRVVPGKGKNILGTILSLALTAAAPGIGSALASAAGFGGVWVGSTLLTSSFIYSTGVSLVGRLVINAIAPPPKQKNVTSKSDPTTQFISGSSNSITPFGTIPRVLGKMRFVPPYGCRPYTETVGDDQYVRMLFCLGYGPLEISQLKFGDTLLSEFDNVEVEICQGYPDDAPLTLITDQVLQNDLNVLLKQVDGYQTRTTDDNTDEISIDVTLPNGLVEFTGSGGKKTREVKAEVQYAPTGTSDWSAGVGSYTSIAAQNSPELAKPNGAGSRRLRIWRVILDQAAGTLKAVDGDVTVVGSQAPVFPIVPEGYLKIAAVYRYSDDTDTIGSAAIVDERDSALFEHEIETAGDFTPGTSGTKNIIHVDGGGLQFNGFNISAKQSSALRQNIRFRVPRGKYDVRLRRISDDTDSDKIFDKLYWSALRSIRTGTPVGLSGMALVAIRIKATDQLNGSPEQFNCLAQSILPDWDAGTGAWVAQPTSQVAAIYREVLQGAANQNALADARVDLATLEAWDADNRAAGREYNAVHDSQSPVEDVLQAIAACGRAAPARPEGRFGIVQDKPQTVPRQHFTPRNTTGFKAEQSYPDIAHAFRVRFINRNNGYQPDEVVVYDDGYSADGMVPGTIAATKFEALELPGVTDPDQAWKDARYHIATLRLRPANYSFTADFEHIACTRGDLVKLSHDVVLAGLGAARVKTVNTSGGNVTSVVIDDPLFMTAGNAYGVRFRLNDGATSYQLVDTVPGSQSELTFTAPFAMPVDGDGADTLTNGTLVMLGQAGVESIDLIVKSIVPAGGLSATIACLDAAPGVHLADTGTIPPYDSGVTIPPELQRPPAPVASNVQTADEVLLINADGSFAATITITLAPYAYPLPLTVSALIKATSETVYRPANIINTGAIVRILDVETSEFYDIKLYYKNPSGTASAPLPLSGVQVLGATGKPADVDNFTVNVLGSNAYLSWDPVADIDLAYYRIKYSTAISGADWASSVDLVERVSAPATSITVEAIVGTYLIKAVDAGGRESDAPAFAVNQVNNLDSYNDVATLTESPTFAGAKTDVQYDGTGIRLAGADSIDDWSNVDAIDNFDVGAGALATTGIYNFANAQDLGQVYTSRVTGSITVTGLNLLDNFDTISNVDTVTDIDNDVDPSSYAVELQIRTTNDDPAGSAVWTDWQTFVVGDYAARAYEFRVILTSLATGVTPYITSLSVTIDMPDRLDGVNGLVSNAAGDAITYTPAFRDVPVLNITPSNMGSGDYYTLSSQSETGFNIRFFNAAGTGISRTYNWQAKGFGYAS